jgi:membrane-bound lytic murein transglycosylase B
MKLQAPAALAFCLALAACGGSSAPAENTAQALEEAAEQSTPEAANSLLDSAEQVRQQNIADPAAADQALKAAGNAQAPPPQAPQPTTGGQ